MKHRPRKRFGQHFLTDGVVIERIARVINPRPGEHLVEIGPGLGALTRALLPQTDWYTGVELDRDLYEPLTSLLQSQRHKLISGDALKLAYSELEPQPLRVVGNLPYNISSALVFLLLDQLACIKDMHFLLQAEFVNRMVATPGTKAYGRLSVSTQLWCEATFLFYVEASSFTPAPRVRSAVVRLAPRARPLAPVNDPAWFHRLVREAFSKRRKTLRNALSGLCSETDFAKADIDPNQRAETLSIEDFSRLSNLTTPRHQ